MYSVMMVFSYSGYTAQANAHFNQDEFCITESEEFTGGNTT